MKNNSILLSICIPTKNRQKYCKEAILSILENRQKYFELIIQDNSDEDTLKGVVKKINDRRLVYFYTNDALSSIGNINLSVERASGKFICMIGDDDDVLPHLFTMVEYMDKNNIDSICSNYTPSYIWPNKAINCSGEVKIIKGRFTSPFKEINIQEKLERLFKKGIIDYQQYLLPRLYHGIISKEALDKIKINIGSYFEGLSPDIYSTIALSSFIKSHKIINKPISIAGVCPISTTSQNNVGGHRGELSDIPHLKNRGGYIWDKLVPRFYSVETIWAESALTAARDFEIKGTVENFNKKRFNIVSLAKSKSIKNIIFRELFLNKRQQLIITMQANIYLFIDFINRLLKKIFIKRTINYYNVVNIKDAKKLIIKN
jgi:glycosyltransferase involved in cell wall biosynthesis